MRHAHANFLDAHGRTFVQNALENHHHGFCALDRKPLLPDVTRVQKNFERFGLHQRAQQGDFHLSRRRILIGARFKPVQHPIPHPRVLNVHELGADRVRIDFLQTRDHLAQGHLLIIVEEF